MLILKKLISHGTVRACFYHPEDKNKCVKVVLHKKYSYLLKKELDNNLLFQEKLSLFVPKYYQLVDTNKGLGLETELIKDDHNQLSPRLVDYLKTKKTLSNELINQFETFFSLLLKHHLWFYDFNLENFLIKTINKKEQLIFVDTKSYNRNNSWSFLKLEYIIPILAKIRMKRRIKRFYKRVEIPIPNTLE